MEQCLTQADCREVIVGYLPWVFEEPVFCFILSFSQKPS